MFKKQHHQRAVRTELAGERARCGCAPTTDRFGKAAKKDTQTYLRNVERAKRKEKKRERGEDVQVICLFACVAARTLDSRFTLRRMRRVPSSSAQCASRSTARRSRCRVIS